MLTAWLHTPLALLSGTDLFQGLCQVHSPTAPLSLSPIASHCFFLFLSPSVRESNDQWSAPRTPPGILHGDKLTMGDKVPQYCLRDEEVLNVPFSPRTGNCRSCHKGKDRKEGGMSQCQKINKIGRET